MAVYKATYCYPFLNAIDSRVTLSNNLHRTAQFLKCKVDTSNIDVTGYKIIILDSNNNQIFPLNNAEGKISPIKELGCLSDSEDGINTGVNGTFLQIPFFQNYNAPLLNRSGRGGEDSDYFYSYNAIYYVPKLTVSLCLDRSTYEASNWVYDATTSSWKPQSSETTNLLDNKIDGEMPLDGQLILVVNDTTDIKHNGVYKATLVTHGDEKSVELVYYSPVLSEFLGNSGVINVIQGTQCHNKCYSYSALVDPILGRDYQDIDYPLYTGDLWVDYAGRTISGFNMNGTTYKWEITLYQGDCGNITITAPHPTEIVYNNLSNEYYDMKLSSGTILGSTPNRIQISDIEETSIPTSNNNTGVILQTRYMRLGLPIKDENEHIIGVSAGNSLYVQSYDATYGHVYPIEGELDSTIIDTPADQYVQFYKHSENPEQILNKDIVNYGFGSDNDSDQSKWTNIEVGYINANSSATASVTTKVLYCRTDTDNIDALGQYIVNNDIPTGTTFLLTKASTVESGSRTLAPERNGVYTLIGKNRTFYKQGSSSPITNCLEFERSATYQNWAAFIGKVIYVSNGPLRGQNIESLANAGTFKLWNPLSAIDSGDSPLYFTAERPIILFENKLKQTVNYFADTVTITNGNAVIVNSETISNATTATEIEIPMTTVDGFRPEIGEIVLCQGKYGTVISISATAITLGDLIPVENQAYYYVLNGSSHGHKIYKAINALGEFGENPSPNNDLTIAKVLKNTTTWTYISPYIGIKPGMKLKLLNNKTVTFIDQYETIVAANTPWISISQYDSVLNRINAGLYLKEPIKSFDNLDKDVPWSYELRSYFKTSDQNVFYSYESPYLKIKVNGGLYGHFSELLAYSPFAVITNGEEYGLMQVEQNNQSVDYVPFYVRTYDSNSKLVGRAIHLGAEYIQYQGLNWENYRWVLYDTEGNILQDTGKKYDKTIDVYFYGLANDTTGVNIYYAVLYIEDSLGNMLQYTIKLDIESSATVINSLSIPFTAEYDCASRSVQLMYEDQGIVKPSYYYNAGTSELSGEELAYNTMNPDVWDKGISYTEDQFASITGINYQDTAPVCLTPIAGIDDPNCTQGEVYSTHEFSSYTPSKSINYGINYDSYFGRSYDSFTPSTQKQYYTLSYNEDSGSSNDFYYTARFQLDDNYCGNIIAIDVEGVTEFADEHTHNNPTIALSRINPIDLTGYLTFSVFLPDNFNTSNVINEHNHKFGFTVYKDLHGSTEDKLVDKYFTGSTFSNASQQYFYLQDKNHIEDVTNINNEFLHFSLNKKLWFDMKSNNYAMYDENRYITSTDKFLGNLCLLRPQDDIDYRVSPYTSTVKLNAVSDRLKESGYYWVENRPYLKTWLNNEITAGTYTNLFSLGQNGAITCYDDSSSKYDNGLLKWAGELDGEENSYWLETNNEASLELPIYWDDIDDDIEGFEEHGFTCFEGVDRHPLALDNKNYIVKCRIDDIGSIYTNFANISISAAATSSTTVYGSVELFLDLQTHLTSLGKLYIIEGAEPQLTAPLIALDSTTSVLTIVDSNPAGATERFNIYVDGDLTSSVAKAVSGNTTYNLNDLGLGAGMYTITLRATGTGFRMSSDSNSVSYRSTPQLAAPVIHLNSSTNVLSWSAVEHATSYSLLGGPATIGNITTTSVDLPALSWAAGTYTLTVIAQAVGYVNSDPSNSCIYIVIPQLDTPTNLSVSDNTLSLDEVVNAESYEVSANGVVIGTYDVSNNS